jgi:hypothetical protein
MSKYTVEVYDDMGRLLADLSGIADARNIDLARNRAGSCRFTIDMDLLENLCDIIGLEPQNLLEINKNDIRIRVGTKYIFGGQITDRNTTLDYPSRVEVTAIGWFELLSNRFLDQDTIYTSRDAGAIAWDLIYGTQAQTYGDFGILPGTIMPSVNRSFKFVIDKNIKDAIIELSNFREGFDFEVDYDKQFHVYYPYQGFEKPNLTFIFSQDRGKGNIIGGTIYETGSKMANMILARGEGFGDAQLRVEESDINYMNTYGIRTKIVDYPDVTMRDTLTEHAQNELELYRKNLQIPEIVVDGSKAPYMGDYGIGDRIRIKIERYKMFKDFHTKYYRIDAISIGIDDNDVETIKLTLSDPSYVI